MKTERNDLQRAVDRQLSGLSWGEKQRRAVMNQLSEEEKPMKRKLSLSLALVLAAMMLTVGALAAATLLRSPEADAVTQARQAVMERYGLTVETLGVFYNTYERTDDGWRVTFHPATEISAVMNERLVGVYTVEKAADGLQASWSNDGVDPAAYADGSLSAPVWGQEQLRKYLHEGHEEALAIGHQNLAGTTPPPAPEAVVGASVWMEGTVEVAPQEGDMPMAEAKEIMRAAVQAELALTDDQAALLDAAEDYDEAAVQLICGADGTRMWEFEVEFDLDGTHYSGGVFINAKTGEVVRIAYSVLGNG